MGAMGALGCDRDDVMVLCDARRRGDLKLISHAAVVGFYCC